jgi:hypothetical protein
MNEEIRMKNDQKVIVDNDAILAEILIAPSLESIENRFTKASDAAECSGRCESGGGCKAAW